MLNQSINVMTDCLWLPSVDIQTESVWSIIKPNLFLPTITDIHPKKLLLFLLPVLGTVVTAMSRK